MFRPEIQRLMTVVVERRWSFEAYDQQVPRIAALVQDFKQQWGDTVGWHHKAANYESYDHVICSTGIPIRRSFFHQRRTPKMLVSIQRRKQTPHFLHCFLCQWSAWACFVWERYTPDGACEFSFVFETESQEDSALRLRLEEILTQHGWQWLLPGEGTIPLPMIAPGVFTIDQPVVLRDIVFSGCAFALEYADRVIDTPQVK